MTAEVEKASRFLRDRGVVRLAGAISTGSGQNLELPYAQISLEIGYPSIPGMFDPCIPGHEGLLRILETRGGDWALWIGRRHFYQGYTHEEIGLYIDISRALGAEKLICVNAAGGLDPTMAVGEVIIVERYRCFIPIPGIERTIEGGPWRETSSDLVGKLASAAEEAGVYARRGAYVGVPGPTYETEAEAKWLRSLGCDVVGMSTVPELIRAIELGMDGVAISVVANVHGSDETLTHEDVVRAGERSVGEVARLLAKYLGVV